MPSTLHPMGSNVTKASPDEGVRATRPLGDHRVCLNNLNSLQQPEHSHVGQRLGRGAPEWRTMCDSNGPVTAASSPSFSLGTILITSGAREALSQRDVLSALRRHADGDWGDLCPEDWNANKQALQEGTRLLSAYLSEDRSSSGSSPKPTGRQPRSCCRGSTEETQHQQA